MGNGLVLRGEVLTLAEELAALTGETVEQALLEALRDRLKIVRSRIDYVARAQELTAAFRATLTEPPPTSDHSHLYDKQTGLPV